MTVRNQLDKQLVIVYIYKQIESNTPTTDIGTHTRKREMGKKHKKIRVPTEHKKHKREGIRNVNCVWTMDGILTAVNLKNLKKERKTEYALDAASIAVHLRDLERGRMESRV